MVARYRYSPLLLLTGLLSVLSLGRCNCGGEQDSGVSKEFCTGLGLEYKEADGKGYCFKAGETVLVDVDCSTADASTPCDDGDACTFGDHCEPSSGACVGSPLTGLDDGNPCTEDICDPATGEIRFDPAPLDGQACDDGDVCSSNDTCNAGHCEGDYSVDSNGDVIDDGDACTRDFCDASGLRQNVAYTAAEAVAAGVPGVSAADLGNSCARFECNVGGSDVPHVVPLNGIDCADPGAGRGNGACVSWTCRAGQCEAAIDEQALESASVSNGSSLHPACRMRECDTSTGDVVYVVDPRKVGAPCDDANSCSFADVCQIDGSCAGSELAHGTSCDDGNACSVGDYCHQFVCRSGKDYLALANSQADPNNPGPDDSYRDPQGILAAGDACKQYTCDPVRGVVVSSAADGSDCDDGNPCTSTSSCQAGICVGERNVTNDNVPCAKPGNVCEEGRCDKGVCVNFQPVSDSRSCEGTNVCKTYECRAASGRGVCSATGDVSDNLQVECNEIGECLVGLCISGVCQQQLDRRDGLPCTDFDPRCNAPVCDNGSCIANPIAEGTNCALSPEDLTDQGLSIADLACNTGVCRGVSVGRCVPELVNADGYCDDGNPCNGEDWCRASGSMGRCLEHYTSVDPSATQASDPSCLQNPGQCYDNPLPTAQGAIQCELDGKPETVGRCKYDGTCVEISQVVDDQNDCTEPVFSEVTGQVTLEQVDNGRPCHLVSINPCVENLGICVDGTCHTNPMPDGSTCDLAGQAVPGPDDLPSGHSESCYAEICRAGECVIDTAWQDGRNCDDGEATCTLPGTCQSGACQADTTPRGYGETCQPDPSAALVDIRGAAIDSRDAQCWVTFECSENGQCNVAVAKAADNMACDYGLDGDLCDGWCRNGACVAHPWSSSSSVSNASCDDGEPCTRDECNGNGDCTHSELRDGPQAGCLGASDSNSCQKMSCVAGTCTAIDDNFARCDDSNPCTSNDHCVSGACIADAFRPEGFACDFDYDDSDCQMAVCDANGQCLAVADEPDGSLCVASGGDACSSYSCEGGQCVYRGYGFQQPDGAVCDTNGVPCDEACLDFDGALGDSESHCRPFDDFIGLLTARNMAAAGDNTSASDAEERACRALMDPTFDPDSSDPDNSGHDCARYLCYYGACRAWDDQLPRGLFSRSGGGYGSGPAIVGNPTNGEACSASGPCTENGVCRDNVCVSYNHRDDGALCGAVSCLDGDQIAANTCQAGACVDQTQSVLRCSRGLATCQAASCAGASCSYACSVSRFDYANSFEDIAGIGDAWSSRLHSPLDTDQLCGDFSGSGPATEQQRMACDDGSLLLDLESDLGFIDPDADHQGFWFYNRRYRYISISANGTVILHKDHPAALTKSEETRFVMGNVGGHVFDPDALDQPGDPVNNGEQAAQIRVFRDDLTLITDVTEDPSNIPTDPSVRYGNFERIGEILTRHMPGQDNTLNSVDDYLIVQWQDLSFYGCTADPATRAHMTFQLKWWPSTGQMVFAYPPFNADGPESIYCLPGRIYGSDASIGLYDEGGAPSDEVASNAWTLRHDSGPGSDMFDDYRIFWPSDRPTTHYNWRGHADFDDITRFSADRGTALGQKLDQVSQCNDCCERVELDPAITINGWPADHLTVCADGYLHFGDYSGNNFWAQSLNRSDSSSLVESPAPGNMVAPFWGELRMSENPYSGVYWLDTQVAGRRQIIVQWTLADYPVQTGILDPRGLLSQQQERGERLCGDDGDNDGDRLVDCDDSSCACAVTCGGLGCGLTFEAIVHEGLGQVEFRYLDEREVYVHAADSMGALSIGVRPKTRSGRSTDLYDGRNGGDLLPSGRALDPADDDELLPGQQDNVLLPQSGSLSPYGDTF